MQRTKMKNGKTFFYPYLIKGIISKSKFKYEIESLQERFQQGLQNAIWICKVLYHIIVFIRECEVRKVDQVNNISMETIYVLKNSEDPNILIAVEDQNNKNKDLPIRSQLRILVRNLGVVLKKDENNQERDYLEQLMSQILAQIFPDKNANNLFYVEILKQIYFIEIKTEKYWRSMSAVNIIKKPFYIESDSEEIVVKYLETEERYNDREITLLENLSIKNKNNFTQMFCYTNWKATQFMFMKKYDITLEDLNKNYRSLKEQEILYLVIQLLLSLQELHSYNIIHRDLKPQNIMFQMINGEKFNKEKLEIKKLCCVLIDFDRSTAEKSMNFENDSKYEGTKAYQPPEGTQNKYNYSYDVWQIGYIILCLFLQQNPKKEYSDIRERPISQNKYDEVFKSDFQNGESLYQNYFEIIKKMMDFDPKERPEVKIILELFRKYQK